MYELDQKYIDQLEEIAAAIQESEELQQYLENEEEEEFLRLKERFEPQIAEVYNEVAMKDPLQLIPFELVLLDEAFEGLFLPKLLGYSVLRGETDATCKYTRPQDHFKEILLAICNSANFEILKKRIGQAIQIGFALSSDIWITNLINSIANKRIRYFLQSQKLDKYRHTNERTLGYERFKRQFKQENYHTAAFPDELLMLKVLFSPLKHFIIHRITLKADNSSIIGAIKTFIENETFKGAVEHLQIMSLYANFFELDEADQAHLKEHFNSTRKMMPEFGEHYLAFLLEIHTSDEIEWEPKADLRISAILDKTIADDLAKFYNLADQIHSKGYITPEVQEAVKVFYDQYEGLSVINECLRQTISTYFVKFINNLEESSYPDFFEITKQFPIYMGIFANQHFNQDLEKASMAYVRRLLTKYTDKRGKDYQDIKKFVSTIFVDFNFLTEKEVTEMFKTKRKKKAEG